jgi:dTDP-4-amino-4,6-dideoxygalactose transaminase
LIWKNNGKKWNLIGKDGNIMEKKIQFVDLKKQYEPFKEEILAGISRVLDGMYLFLGENVQSFEKEFADFCNAKHGIGVSDGTTALHLALLAMGIGAGDEVITVPNTFIATVEAIILAGAQPVFVDIDPQTYLVNTEEIESKITHRTKALLPVHLYGQMVDMERMREISDKHGLMILEDACQAHGAEFNGKRPGHLSDAATYSFYFSKNLGAYGEGGFITTNDDELARRLRMMRDHGSERKYYHDLIGMNARPDEIQAVVLRAKLKHLADWTEARRQHAMLYNKLLQGTPVITPKVESNARHVYHLYVIRAPQRDALQAFLREKGIFTGIHYPVPIHMQNAVGYLGLKEGQFANTERVVKEILSLPMFAELSDADIARFASTIKEFYAK